MSRFWARARKAWAAAGTIVLATFVAWSLLAFRANATARAALRSDDVVSLRMADDAWFFEPSTPAANAGTVLFFPGGLVDPAAYAPLMRGIAAHGHRAVIVPLPRRGAFGGAEDPAVLRDAHALLRAGDRWVVAGHSKGGKVAAMYADRHPEDVAGLVLIGTSHPRDVDLSDAAFPVMQVLGERDPVASIERADRNRRNLPAGTTRIVVTGGNHSQFGEYGFQPGDRTARIPRERQRAIVLEALLRAVARNDNEETKE